MNHQTAAYPVAFVTGAGSGIGRAVARRLGASGYRLALIGRRLEPLRATADMVGGDAGASALTLTVDAGVVQQMIETVDRTVEHFGRIDVLINNAGVAPLAPIEATTPEMLDECFRTNAIGPAAAITRAWPVFQRQRRGCIVNVSTMGTADPFAGFFAYAASKASVNLMARSSANEGRAFNIRAFSVAPGAVETDMLRANFSGSVIPPEKCLSPDDVATVILECVSGARDHQCGETIFVPSPPATHA